MKIVHLIPFVGCFVVFCLFLAGNHNHSRKLHFLHADLIVSAFHFIILIIVLAKQVENIEHFID